MQKSRESIDNKEISNKRRLFKMKIDYILFFSGNVILAGNVFYTNSGKREIAMSAKCKTHYYYKEMHFFTFFYESFQFTYSFQWIRDHKRMFSDSVSRVNLFISFSFYIIKENILTFLYCIGNLKRRIQL